eukprot:1160792-Pelagomonas_calceolata.AAC.3
MGCASSSPQEEQEGLKSTDRARTPSSKQGSERKGAAGEATLIKSKDGSMILAKPDAVEVVVSEGPRDGQTPPATERISSTSDGLKSLSSNEADNVQDTLMKVRGILEAFVDEGGVFLRQGCPGINKSPPPFEGVGCHSLARRLHVAAAGVLGVPP